MSDAFLDDLKDLGAGQAAADSVVHLYRQAFADHGARALWNVRVFERPTITQALMVADALRIEGDTPARHLAAQIEAACRAAL